MSSSSSPRRSQLVEPGSWTAHDDLAELADTTPNEVADFLASGKVKLPNAYRVLHADGSIPAEGMLQLPLPRHRPAPRLAGEGIEFDADGRASQEQRLTADALKDLLDERAEERDDDTPSGKRAWMVRGSSVDGFNLSREWLSDGFVSLSASQLGASIQDTATTTSSSKWKRLPAQVVRLPGAAA